MADLARDTEPVRTWPDLVGGLYEQLTGRGAEISYEFEDLEVEIPTTVGEGADRAHWRIDGTVRVRTRDPDE